MTHAVSSCWGHSGPLLLWYWTVTILYSTRDAEFTWLNFFFMLLVYMQHNKCTSVCMLVLGDLGHAYGNSHVGWNKVKMGVMTCLIKPIFNTLIVRSWKQFFSHIYLHRKLRFKVYNLKSLRNLSNRNVMLWSTQLLQCLFTNALIANSQNGVFKNNIDFHGVSG